MISDRINILKTLRKNPTQVFSLVKKDSVADDINQITKSLLDPIAKDHSVLDEIYTDGLDSTQVWGQVQMVLQNIGEAYLFDEIPRLKDTYGFAEEQDNGNTDESEGAENDSDVSDFDDSKEDKAEDISQQDDEEEEEFFSLDENDQFPDEKLSHLEDPSDAESDDTKVPSDSEPVSLTKDVHGLNDGFFDIDQFNKQIIALEGEENQLEENDIDLFADANDSEDDENEQEMEYYDEFFDKPGHTVITESSPTRADERESSENESLGENEYEQAVGSAMLDLFAESAQDKSPAKNNLSSFEKQQQRLQSEIAELEAELVAEKKWTMKGEVKSGDRPSDSLLNDDEAPMLEFDRTSKPVPVITDEVTETIEDLIKRRVRNNEFDDLPRRLITDVGKFVQKKKTEVSEQKSAKSLAEIYEDEFHGVEPEDKISEEVQTAHQEITDLFTKLSYKLDSLCSAHYIPKPNEFKSIEIKVSDAPAAISMEDAQPLHISDEVKLAPQEIYRIGDDKPKADGARGTSQVQLKSGLSYSKDELDREDKQRLRRAKKRAKSKHFNELKEVREQKDKENLKSVKEGDRKRQKVGEVVDTLSRAKNLTVIDDKGQLRDAQGKLKKSSGPQTSNDYRL